MTSRVSHHKSAREAGVSWHHGGPIKRPPETPPYITDTWF